MNILYVEDNPLDADLTRRALARYAPDYSLEIVATVAVALARIAATGYDLILVDVNLPDGDGIHILVNVRVRGLPVAVVMLTGLDDEEAAVAALKAGADDYIVKRDDYLERLPAILRDALTRNSGRMLRRSRPLPILAMGLDSAEYELLLRQLSRYAPHITVAHVAGQAELLDRLMVAHPDDAYEAIILAADGSSITGLNTLKLLRQEHGLDRPILLVADQSSADLALQAVDLGAADYLVRHPGYIARIPAAIENCVNQSRLARLVAQLRSTQNELEAAYDSTLEGWARALELRDHETEGHARRVTDLSVRLAVAYGVTAAEIVHFRRGALLHDIGKMGISDAILLKPGPLTADERREIERHPQLAYDMLSPIAFLHPALDIPYCHHEHWDGKGYPRGLRGEAIPAAARIFAVIDVWDALTSDRPYRRAISADDALAIIMQGSGSHFDPYVVELFLRLELWRADLPQ